MLDFKAVGHDRKVISIFGDVAASGAYYVALASDHIIGHPTTITGSIGVLIQTLNVQQLGEKIGVKSVTIKSGKDKDVLNPFLEMTEEQRAMLQGIVDELHDRFISLVAENRGLADPDVRRVSEAQIFTAPTALELGLIDEIGYWNDAVRTTAGLLGVEDVKVYRYEAGFGLKSFLKGAQSWDPVSDVLTRPSGPRLFYRWNL